MLIEFPQKALIEEILFLMEPKQRYCKDRDRARSKVSREFHIYSRGILDLAYIGATHLNF